VDREDATETKKTTLHKDISTFSHQGGPKRLCNLNFDSDDFKVLKFHQTLTSTPLVPQWTVTKQGCRQDFAAGEPKNTEGPHFLNTISDECSNRGDQP